MVDWGNNGDRSILLSLLDLFINLDIYKYNSGDLLLLETYQTPFFTPGKSPFLAFSLNCVLHSLKSLKTNLE